MKLLNKYYLNWCYPSFIHFSFLVLLNILSLNLSAQQVFTIGGNQPDYANLNEAITALKTMTLTEAIVFNIRDGIYGENINLTEIAGASTIHTITFQSESNTASTVIIQRDPNGGSQPVIEMDGATHIHFLNLTFGGGTFANSLTLANISYNSGNTNFTNCIFLNQQSTGVLINNFSYSSPEERFVVSNCEFKGGAIGIRSFGNAISITDCFFEQQTQNAIYLNAGEAIIVERNQIQNCPIGIQLNDRVNGALLKDNQIVKVSDFGIMVDNNGYKRGANFAQILANNFIELSTTATGSCIQSKRSDEVYLYHNTLIQKNSAATIATLNLNEISDHRIFNNIIATSSSTTPMVITNNYFDSQSYLGDHNGFYSPNGTAVQLQSNEYTLAEWQDVEELDIHSVFANPLLLTDTYLSTASPLREAGIFLMDFATDIDDNLRSDPPDIGVANLPRLVKEAGLTVFINPIEPYENTPQPLIVNLKNYGSDPLNSVEIRWSIDDVIQSPVQWTGTLLTDETVAIDLGTLPTSTNDLPRQITAWLHYATMPDEYAPNDTLSKTFRSGLAGDYTIGDNQANFPTINAAIARLRETGVTAAVNFLIQPGTYEELIELRSFIGMGSNAPVTFRSATGNATDVDIFYDGIMSESYETTTVVKLENVSHVRFENLTFSLTEKDSGQENRIFELADNTSHIQFNNNVFRRIPRIDFYYSNLYAITIRGSNIRDINLFQNEFVELFYGFQSNQSYVSDFLLEGNVFNSVIIPIGITFCNNLTINKNIINDPQRVGNSIGIHKFTGELFFTNNQIINTLYGVEIDGSTANSSSDNTLHFLNNYINATTSDGNDVVDLYYIGHIEFVHNTIRTINDPSFTSAALAINGFVSNGLFANNIISVEGEDQIAIELRVSNSNFFNNFTFDANVYQLPEGNNFGKINHSDIADLSTWRVEVSDAVHSITSEVNFFGQPGYHTYGNSFNQIGLPIASVTTDIEGTLRDPEHPQPGVYEFSIPNQDAGIIDILTPTAPFLSGTQPVQATVVNYAATPINSIKLDYEINNQLYSTNWSGTLEMGDTIFIDLPETVFTEIIENKIKVTIKTVNGSPDEFVFNNNFLKDQIYTGLSGEYTIGGTTPDFADFKTMTTILQRNGVAGATTFNVRSGEYQENVSIHNVAGSSATTPIIIQSEVADSSAVRITANLNSSTNTYKVFEVTQVEHLTLRHLSFIASGERYHVVGISNGAKFVTLENCHIEAPLGIGGVIITDDYNYSMGNTHDIIIRNNYFKGVSNGIELYHQNPSLAPAERSYNISMIDNRFDFTGSALEALRFKNIAFTDNIVNCRFGGISFEECGGEILIKNNAIKIQRGDGIYLLENEIDTNTPIQVLNNYIADTLLTEHRINGLRVYKTSHIDFVHNTVRFLNKPTSSSFVHAAANLGELDNINFYNNIFSVPEGAIYLYYSDLSEIEFHSDHNAFNHDGDNFAVDVEDFYQWQSVTNQDNHSKLVDPYFINETSYIPQNTSLNYISNPDFTTITDINRQPRSTTQPTVGVYEIVSAMTDLAIEDFPFINGLVTATEQTANIQIRNTGSTTITAFSIDWRWNQETRTTINWTGELTIGAMITLDLGIVNPTLGEGNEIFAQINLNDDQVLVNNTLSRDAITARLAGTYSIGSETSDFVDLESAIDALGELGVGAPVIFELCDGTHYMTDYYYIYSYYGADESRPVTFRSASNSASASILRGNSGSRDRIILDNAKWVNFEQLTFLGEGREVQLSCSDSDHLRFINCRFELRGSYNLSSLLRAPMHLFDCNEVIIENCEFINRPHALIASSSDEVTTPNNLVIRNNHFMNQDVYAVKIEDYKNVQLIGNIFSTQTTFSNATSLILNNITDLNFEKNQVISTANNLGTGIYLDNIQSSSEQKSLITNNYLNLTSQTATALLIQNSSDVEMYHNTINTLAARCLDLNNNSGGKIFNNIFHNRSDGYIFYSQNDDSECDYNNYFSTNGGTIYDNAEYETVTAWNSAVPTKNANAWSIDPVFEPLESYYFTNLDLDNKGVATINTPTDIEQNLRAADRPDLGCFELDNEPPIISCEPEYSIELPDGNMPIVTSDLILSAMDNSGKDLVYSFDAVDTLLFKIPTCTDLVHNVLKIYITDQQGNQSSCEVPIQTTTSSIEFCECTHTDLELSGNSMNLEKSIYRSDDNITTTTTIFANHPLHLYAKNSITLMAGFQTHPEAIFTATTEDCIAQENLALIEERSLLEEKEQITMDLSVTPNPFFQEINIYYTLDKVSSIRLFLLNSYGSLVKTFANRPIQSTGSYQQTFNLTSVSAGVYYVVLEVDGEPHVHKVVQLKR